MDKKELTDFINRIKNFDIIPHSQKIIIFGYYITKIANEPYFDQKSIRRCYELLDDSPPANISDFLLKLKESKKLIPTNGGYRVHRSEVTSLEISLKITISEDTSNKHDDVSKSASLETGKTQKSKNTQSNVAIIFTAIQAEYQVVRKYLGENLQTEKDSEGYVYKYGKFDSGNVTWKVVIYQLGRGNVNASGKITHIIEHFKPKIILLVGTAGGFKEKQVNLGDIVVASKIYDYHSGSVEDVFKSRPEVHTIHHHMEDLAKVEAAEKDWLKYFVGSPPKPTPIVLVDPIASGEHLVKSLNSSTYKLIRNNYNDAVAVEMEGFGFSAAARLHPELYALIIRGVSDLIDNKGAMDKTDAKEKATESATAFAFNILSKID